MKDTISWNSQNKPSAETTASQIEHDNDYYYMMKNDLTELLGKSQLKKNIKHKSGELRFSAKSINMDKVLSTKDIVDSVYFGNTRTLGTYKDFKNYIMNLIIKYSFMFQNLLEDDNSMSDIIDFEDFLPDGDYTIKTGRLNEKYEYRLYNSALEIYNKAKEEYKNNSIIDTLGVLLDLVKILDKGGTYKEIYLAIKFSNISDTLKLFIYTYIDKEIVFISNKEMYVETTDNVPIINKVHDDGSIIKSSVHSTAMFYDYNVNSRRLVIDETTLVRIKANELFLNLKYCEIDDKDDFISVILTKYLYRIDYLCAVTQADISNKLDTSDLSTLDLLMYCACEDIKPYNHLKMDKRSMRNFKSIMGLEKIRIVRNILTVREYFIENKENLKFNADLLRRRDDMFDKYSKDDLMDFILHSDVLASLLLSTDISKTLQSSKQASNNKEKVNNVEPELIENRLSELSRYIEDAGYYVPLGTYQDNYTNGIVDNKEFKINKFDVKYSDKPVVLVSIDKYI